MTVTWQNNDGKCTVCHQGVRLRFGVPQHINPPPTEHRVAFEKRADRTQSAD